jgi:signal transduction histidine kinase
MNESLFFSERELNDLQESGSLVNFNPGDLLFYEGESGNTLFFIRQGTVQLFKASPDSQDELLFIRGPGEIAGDILLEEEPVRFASAQALDNVRAVEIEQKKLFMLIGERPDIALSVVSYLASKARDSDLFRVGLLQKKNEQILRSYEELKNAQLELLESERLAAVGSLASKIIHDIKGTITPLKIYSENLDFLPEEARRIGIATIKQSIIRILRICEELLEYVRGKPITLRKTRKNINEFVKGEINLIADLLERSKILVSSRLDYQGNWHIDDERLGRVLQNLLLNARDAMPDGGSLSIETFEKDDSLCISISDNGCGISGEVIERIFEPFYSHGKKKGTGLGLTISKKIMEEHGGSIDVESEPGKGTKFTLSIPK